MANLIQETIELTGYWSNSKYAVKTEIEGNTFEIETSLTGGVSLMDYGTIVDTASDYLLERGYDVQVLKFGGVYWSKQ
jgi:hypothetical protein